MRYALAFLASLVITTPAHSASFSISSFEKFCVKEHGDKAVDRNCMMYLMGIRIMLTSNAVMERVGDFKSPWLFKACGGYANKHLLPIIRDRWWAAKNKRRREGVKLPPTQEANLLISYIFSKHYQCKQVKAKPTYKKL